ncbi:MAG: hypothetical protein ACTHWA_10210 [Arachnia sp.]
MSAEVDAFSLELLEEAKRFMEKASESKAPEPYLHAAMLLAFSALESHMNGLAEELLLRQGLDLMDQSIL